MKSPGTSESGLESTGMGEDFLLCLLGLEEGRPGLKLYVGECISLTVFPLSIITNCAKSVFQWALTDIFPPQNPTSVDNL